MGLQGVHVKRPCPSQLLRTICHKRAHYTHRETTFSLDQRPQKEIPNRTAPVSRRRAPETAYQQFAKIAKTGQTRQLPPEHPTYLRRTLI
ncbi:uncharacterized protein LAJ45_07840 [Morchella importuna]|uniref:uncharacterized protein n=1 Tax=Morchella importuna TaxID=1174673 RepID=UPI001E8E70EB|nr:uncharacterized protein LAJ45_07840 [Morchella importuna]KAH8148076.1 hypothetical protein LAJ45_07840 [Morchella importuna]